MHQVEVIEQLLFPTPVYFVKLDMVDNEKVVDGIKSEQLSDSGNFISNRGGWQSKPKNAIVGGNIIYSEKNFLAPLLHHVLGIANGVFEKYQIELESAGYWFNINNANDYNVIHNHSPASFSAVYYANAPEGSGNISFRRTDNLLQSITPKQRTEYTYETWDVAPTNGSFILFPGSLDHYVDAGYNNEERISIAFNFFQKR
jgi:uncharacterized protein (TIGR02466 family)